MRWDSTRSTLHRASIGCADAVLCRIADAVASETRLYLETFEGQRHPTMGLSFALHNRLDDTFNGSMPVPPLLSVEIP